MRTFIDVHENLFSRRYLQQYSTICILTGLFFASLLLSMLCQRLEPTIPIDGIYYCKIAESWSNCSSFSDLLNQYPNYRVPPFFLWMMKLLIQCGVSPHSAGIGINMFAGALLPLVLYAIAWQIFHHRVMALAAALLLVVHPTRLELSIEPLRDMLYLLFCGTFFWSFLLAARQKTIWMWSLTATSLVLAAFTRYEALELLPITLFYFVFFYFVRPEERGFTLRAAVIFLASLVVFFLLLVFLMGIETWIRDIYLYWIFKKYFPLFLPL